MSSPPQVTNGELEGGVASAFPVRAFWAWPVGCALLGGIEALVQLERMGGGGGAFVLALFGAAAIGLWPGVLGLLLALLQRRRRLVWPARVVVWVEDLTAPMLAALVVVIVSWWGVAAVHQLFETRHFDFVEESIQVWRAALLVSVPLGIIALYLVMRRLEQRLRTARWRPWLARTLASVLGVCILLHLSSGPFVEHFGALFALCLAFLAVLVAAVWLPRDGDARPVRVGLHVAGALVVLILGALGLEHPTARALLLHDTRVFPVVRGVALAFLDGDGDGETGAWAGGADCDDGDPAVGAWHPEVPGNGIDDNCYGGDTERIQLPPPPGPAGPGRHVPVFLITLDTVRADRLDLMGHTRQTMPYLSEYASQARWFTRAYSPSNHTGFSIISILAGQGPEFLISDPEVLRLRSRKFTAWLPHALMQAGYETWAINPTLVGTDIALEQLRFEHYHVGPFEYAPTNTGTRSQQVATWFEGFVREYRGKRPLFAWIHIADAHAAHAANEHFEVTSTEDAYDNELRWVDLNLGAIFRAIHQRFGDEAIVIVTSDHGEEFGERGAYGHGFSLREAVVHVPLLVRAPGLEPGLETRPTNVAATPATVMQLIGEPAGQMTVPSALSQEPGPVVVGAPFFLSEQRMEVALIEARWKLTVNRSQDTAVLIDLEADPAETTNLAQAEPAEFERMQQRLRDALEQLR